MSAARRLREQEEGNHAKRKRATLDLGGQERGDCSKTVLLEVQKLMHALEALEPQLSAEGTDAHQMTALHVRTAHGLVIAAANLLRYVQEVSELDRVALEVRKSMAPEMERMLEAYEEGSWRPVSFRLEKELMVTEAFYAHDLCRGASGSGTGRATTPPAASWSTPGCSWSGCMPWCLNQGSHSTSRTGFISWGHAQRSLRRQISSSCPLRAAAL